MSDSHHAHSGRSIEDLINWLGIKSRTFGWDAWLVYDRVSVNDSLWRDYISRMQEHPLHSPISGAVTLVENQVWEHLEGVRFYPPQVSFENSRIDSAEVTARVRSMSGSQLTVELSASGEKRITKIERYTPLHGPSLVAALLIDDVDGSATADDQVRMDLSTGQGYRFTFGTTQAMQQKGGAHIQGVFAERPILARCSLLNSLGSWSGGQLAPGSLSARPLPAPDAASTGDGAVALMIAGEGSEPGQLPSHEDDWQYLIPEGYSATLLVSGISVMKKVIEPSLQNICVDATFSHEVIETPDGTQYAMKAAAGWLRAFEVSAPVPPFEEVTYTVSMPLTKTVAGTADFSLKHAQGSLSLLWKSTSSNQTQAPMLDTKPAASSTELDTFLIVRGSQEFSLDAGGGLTLSPVEGSAPSWIRPTYRQGGAMDAMHYENFTALERSLAEGLKNELNATVETMEMSEVNRLRKLGVKFSGDRELNFQSAHLPLDLVLFGAVGATPDAIVLTPTHATLLADGSLKFEVSSGQAGLEWTVDVLEGFDGEPGSITTDGVYTAPSVDSMLGSYTVVRITASAGEHSGSALVSVMSRSIAINPLTFATSFTGGTVRLSAGSVDGRALEWSIESASGATLQPAPVDGDSIYEPGDYLYVPGSTPTGGSFSIDTVTVRNASSGDSQSTPVLVLEQALMGAIFINHDAGLPPDQLQLELRGGAGALPDVEWNVHGDGGSISPEGVYTIDPSASQPFALITGAAESPFGTFFNYLILPVPLIGIDELRHTLA